MKRTRLCLIRHGETAWNADQRIQGQIDIPLSARGRAQARALARALATERFAALYASDLARARDTAHLLAEPHGLAVGFERELRERHYGVFQGLTYAECAVQHAEAFARHRARDPAFAPAGGESLADFATRLTQVFTRLVTRHTGQCIAVVAHGGVLDIVYRRATGMPLTAPRDFPIPNCAINWLAIDEDGWQLIQWAECAHLAQARDEL